VPANICHHAWGNREKSEPLGNFSVLLYRECKCILYLATMYIYCIFSAMSKIKKNAIFSKASRKKCHSNSLWWWPLWSTHLYCYCFFQTVTDQDIVLLYSHWPRYTFVINSHWPRYTLVIYSHWPRYSFVINNHWQLYLGQWLFITKLYLGQWLYITKVYLGQWLFITKLYLGQWLYITKLYLKKTQNNC
jgi:hypothetical protein